MNKPLFFKHNPPEEWQNENYVLHIAMRKDGKHFDMRDKNTREWIYQTSSTRFSDFMQKIANLLGCPHKEGLMGTLHWSHYLNPIKQIRYRITGIWYL